MDTMKAGFAKLDITPDFPVGLSGYGGDGKRLWTDVVEKIYITCVAVKSGEKTLLIYTVDSCNMPVHIQRAYRELISGETEIPEEHIFFGATHVHNASSLLFKENVEFIKGIALQAAKAALADLTPCTLFAGVHEISGMNCTRHYLSDKGEKFSFNMGIPDGTVLVDHLTKSDPDMTMVKFAREEKQDILLINWQAHPDSAYPIGYTSICPSWIGRVRDTVEAKTGMLVAYFTGTGGNQVTHSRIPEKRLSYTWFEYGEKLGEMAVEGLSVLKPVQGSGIQTLRVNMPAEPNHRENHLGEIAKQALALRASGETEKAQMLCRENGIASLGHAKGIRSRIEQSIPDTLELGAFCIGELAFVTNTCETFSDQGLFIKEHSPFAHTFILTGNRGYLACWEAYDYHAYEAVGGSAYYVEGTAEKMADTWLRLLRELKK